MIEIINQEAVSLEGEKIQLNLVGLVGSHRISLVQGLDIWLGLGYVLQQKGIKNLEEKLRQYNLQKNNQKGNSHA